MVPLPSGPDHLQTYDQSQLDATRCSIFATHYFDAAEQDPISSDGRDCSTTKATQDLMVASEDPQLTEAYVCAGDISEVFLPADSSSEEALDWRSWISETSSGTN